MSGDQGNSAGCNPGGTTHALDPVYEQINNNFVYHAPKPGQPEKYTELREEARNLALRFASHCPPSRERSVALTKLEEAVMWANASIARNE